VKRWWLITIVAILVFFVFANASSSLKDVLGDTLMGPIWLLVGILIGALGSRIIKPWLQAHPAWAATAQGIAILADDITDYFRAKYSDSRLAKHIDEMVDKLIEASGLKDSDEFKSKEIAERAIIASLMRKGVAVPVKG